MKLQRAILFVKDLDLMREFYQHRFGLRPIPGGEQPGWIELGAGNARLALHAIPAPIAETITIGDPPRPREAMPIKLVFAVGDVAAERARLVEQGVTMLAVQAWGACDGIDPEGNVFQLVRD